MDAQEMERTLRRMVRVLLTLVAVALVAMMAVLWQTPIGGAWRQLYVFLFGSRAPLFMYITIGAVLIFFAALVLLFRRSGPAAPVAAKWVEAKRGEMMTMHKGIAVAEVEQPLVLEPLYTRKPREESAGMGQ